MLADVGRRGPWNDEQRRSLRSAFQTLVDAFENVLVLRGKRVIVQTNIATAGGLSIAIDCPFKPRSVQALDAYATAAEGVVHSANVALTWQWTATATSGTVTLTDLLGSLPGTGTYTFDVFMEKS